MKSSSSSNSSKGRRRRKAINAFDSRNNANRSNSWRMTISNFSRLATQPTIAPLATPINVAYLSIDHPKARLSEILDILGTRSLDILSFCERGYSLVSLPSPIHLLPLPHSSFIFQNVIYFTYFYMSPCQPPCLFYPSTSSHSYISSPSLIIRSHLAFLRVPLRIYCLSDLELSLLCCFD